VIISLAEGKGKNDPKGIVLEDIPREKDPVFLVGAFAVLGVTAALYLLFW
jgi:solute:Na+ symporter, SSS family